MTFDPNISRLNRGMSLNNNGTSTTNQSVPDFEREYSLSARLESEVNVQNHIYKDLKNLDFDLIVSLGKDHKNNLRDYSVIRLLLHDFQHTNIKYKLAYFKYAKSFVSNIHYDRAYRDRVVSFINHYCKFAINEVLLHKGYFDVETNVPLTIDQRLHLLTPLELWFGYHFAYEELALTSPKDHEAMMNAMLNCGFSVDDLGRPSFLRLIRFIEKIEKKESLSLSEYTARQMPRDIVVDERDREETTDNRMEVDDVDQDDERTDTDLTRQGGDDRNNVLSTRTGGEFSGKPDRDPKRD